MAQRSRLGMSDMVWPPGCQRQSQVKQGHGATRTAVKSRPADGPSRSEDVYDAVLAPRLARRGDSDLCGVEPYVS